MLKKYGTDFIPQAVEYIGEDKVSCMYLYMDILECGVEGEGLGIWASEENGEIKALIYQYYDCIHIFSKGVCNSEDVMTVIKEIDPKVVNSSMENIDAIAPFLDMDKYEYEKNFIITADKYMDENQDVNIEPAKREDIPEIAALMMKDHIYRDVYTYEDLCTSLERRFDDGFGRLFVSRDEEGRLIATNATNAETEEMAVIGGLVTDPEMRGRGLGQAITASTWNLVKREGKRGLAYLLIDNEPTVKLHQKLGYTFLGESGKLIKK